MGPFPASVSKECQYRDILFQSDYQDLWTRSNMEREEDLMKRYLWRELLSIQCSHPPGWKRREMERCTLHYFKPTGVFPHYGPGADSSLRNPEGEIWFSNCFGNTYQELCMGWILGAFHTLSQLILPITRGTKCCLLKPDVLTDVV